jgi:hypothetical protein
MGWFSSKKPPKPNWQFPIMEKFDFPAHIRVFLIAFSYDGVTKELVKWLHNILTSRSVNQKRIVRFTDGGVDVKEQLTEALRDSSPRIELFCGHGCTSGLLGSPRFQVVGSILSDLTFVVYDTEMITETPSSLFAFCCHAARTFGRVFASYKEKQFMGFDGEIPFPVELYDDMRYAFQSVSRNIITSGRISSLHQAMFLEKIDEIDSQAHLYQNPKLVKMWLHNYRKQLRVYA